MPFPTGLAQHIMIASFKLLIFRYGVAVLLFFVIGEIERSWYEIVGAACNKQ